MGGSNEPYLNKPARFPKIALTNAVRQGRDKRTLQTLHATLTSIRDSSEALSGLQDAIAFAIRKKAKDTAELDEDHSQVDRRETSDIIVCFEAHQKISAW